jgi:hypothetical protein
MRTLAWALTVLMAVVFLTTGNPTALACALIAAVAGLGLERK